MLICLGKWGSNGFGSSGHRRWSSSLWPANYRETEALNPGNGVFNFRHVTNPRIIRLCSFEKTADVRTGWRFNILPNLWGCRMVWVYSMFFLPAPQNKSSCFAWWIHCQIWDVPAEAVFADSLWKALVIWQCGAPWLKYGITSIHIIAESHLEFIWLCASIAVVMPFPKHTYNWPYDWTYSSCIMGSVSNAPLATHWGIYT